MDKIKFIDYVGKNIGRSYHWVVPGYDFVACLKPLSPWELWSIGGGKNGKVRVLVGPEDFINVSAYVVDRSTGKVETYRFLWTSFSKFEEYQRERLTDSMGKGYISGCDPQPWWLDKKVNSVFSVLAYILDGTEFSAAFEYGDIESAEFHEEELS